MPEVTRTFAIYRQLSFTILAFTLVMILITFGIVWYTIDHVIDLSGNTLSLVAEESAHQMDQFIRQKITEVQFMAWMAGQHFENHQYLNRYLLQKQANNPELVWLAITDRDGLIVVTSDKQSIGTSVKNDSWFKASRGHVVVADVEPFGMSRGGPDTIGFTTHIRGANEEFLGVISVRVTTEDLKSSAEKSIHMAATGSSFLGQLEYQYLQKDGHVFVDSDLLHKGNVNLVHLGLPSALLRTSASSGYLTERHARRGVSVITAYASMPKTSPIYDFGWRVLVRVDRARVLAGFGQMLSRTAIGCAVVLILITMILVWTLGRMKREHARAEQERERAEEAGRQTALILHSIDTFFIQLDATDTILEWNPAAERTFRISASKAIGRRLTDLPIKWDWEAGMTNRQSPLANSARRFTTDRLIANLPDHQRIFLQVSITTLPSTPSPIVVMMGEDITERIRAEKEIAQTHKLESIGQLAAGIAHEINTPTQYIGDNTRFLADSFNDLASLVKQYRYIASALRTGPSPTDLWAKLDAAEDQADLDYLLEEIPKAIQQSLEGIERVTSIVRAMKEFAHPDQGQPAFTDLNKAIQSTITVARNEWKYVAEMVTAFDPELPLVPCHPGDVNQVVLNLIVNAAHAIADRGGGQKGAITVSTHSHTDHVEIRIQDTGTGIPPSIRNKIFDPFFTTKEVGRGTGQGLSIARSVIVEKHGGTLRFETEEGRGTTFIVLLPINVNTPLGATVT